MKMRKRKPKWQELSGAKKFGTIGLGTIQISLAVAAWADLALRPAAEVNGKKAVWAAVIAINFIGPALYFLVGRRTAH